MTEPAYLPSVEEQLASVLQMFGHVLKVIGEPVEVKQDDLTTSLGDTHFIATDYTEDSVVFSLKEK
jgi:hypothetical protein